MKNFKIGTVMGIPIKVNITLLIFLPVLAWIISTEGQLELWSELISSIGPEISASELEPNAFLIGTVAAVSLFLGVTIHELGHSWVAQRYDITISSITLWIFGGMAHMEELPEEWKKEFWIAIAGPITSIALGVLGFVGLLLVPGSLPTVAFAFGYFAIMNVVLAVFNMVPAFPMDGGRILRSLLARSRPWVEATQIAATVGKFFAVLMAIVGLFGNPLLILIALFVYIAAGSESRATVIRELLRGVRVSEIMTRVSEDMSVPSDTSVQDLVNRMLSERKREYLVTDKTGSIVGVVSLDEVRNVREVERDAIHVGEVANKETSTVSPQDDAFRVLEELSKGSSTVLVEENGEVIGTVTHDDLIEAMQILQGIGPRTKPVSDYAYP